MSSSMGRMTTHILLKVQTTNQYLSYEKTSSNMIFKTLGLDHDCFDEFLRDPSAMFDNQDVLFSMVFHGFPWFSIIFFRLTHVDDA